MSSQDIHQAEGAPPATNAAPASVAMQASGNSSSAVSSSHGLFDFDKLPNEIKNDIYERTVVAHTPIVVTRHVNRRRVKAKGHDFKYCGHTDQQDIYFFTIDCKQGDCAGQAIEGIGGGSAFYTIFRKNYQEAIGLQYWANTYVFTHPSAFVLFCEKSGKHSAYLQHVEIQNMRPWAHTKILGALASGTKLRSLKLVAAVGYVWSGDEILKLVEPLSHSLAPAGHHSSCEPGKYTCDCMVKQQRRVLDMIDVVALGGPDPYGNMVVAKTALNDSWAAEYRKSVLIMT
ncbi:hypothetical protein LTR22_011216 [Elasticomyces elasticus]|nr:hypothetical protein LTR22_011216 [Elasticomyces elasticus]KAK5753193.1 hypothetical protein LTS12_016764 [Elasticomyces elasticus]